MITPFTILYGYLLLGIHPDHTGKRRYTQIIKKARFIIIYGEGNVKGENFWQQLRNELLSFIFTSQKGNFNKYP